MNPSETPYSFFATPVWPRSQFSGPPARRQRRGSDASSSSSDASADEPAPPEAWTPVNPRSLSPGALAPGEAPPADTSDSFHRTAVTRRGRHTKHKSALLSSYNLVPIPTAAWTLRKKHLSVLTTILYRSLLEREWKRAERAFACLIRGKDIDLRQVWGLGLQLLLRRDMRDAVEYLERLALFFPYRLRLHSHHPAVALGGAAAGKKRQHQQRLPPNESAVEFQPALFSLLIEASRFRNVEGVRNLGEGEEGREELGATRPERIKERLEELMLTPPWSDMPGLMCLRGMVCLWMADLEEFGDGGEDVDMGGDLERREKAQELRREAKGLFQAVREKGGVVPECVEEAMREEEEDEDMVDT